MGPGLKPRPKPGPLLAPPELKSVSKEVRGGRVIVGRGGGGAAADFKGDDEVDGGGPGGCSWFSAI